MKLTLLSLVSSRHLSLVTTRVKSRETSIVIEIIEVEETTKKCS